MGSLVHAYTQGVTAHDHGQQLGTNPYDPGAEPSEYEAWEDGWSAKNNWTDNRMFDVLSEAVGKTIEKELL